MAWKVHSENWKNLMIRKPASKAAFKVSRAHTDKQLLSCYNHRTICARAKKECTRSCFAETKFRRHFLKDQKITIVQDFVEIRLVFLYKRYSGLPNLRITRANLKFIFLHRHQHCRCTTDIGSLVPLCFVVVPSS